MIMMLLDGVEGNGSRDARREYHINTFETSSLSGRLKAALKGPQHLLFDSCNNA
jgi:hypothetical protein